MNKQEDRFLARRERMVAEQIAGRGIKDKAILRAMRAVPREHFVPEKNWRFAYDDTPLPIPGRQTISQPYVVALMLSKLNLQPDDCVLEIGTGSGYAAALLGEIVREVHTVERIAELADYAGTRLASLNYENVSVHRADGTLGWPPASPYQAIMVSAGGPSIPEPLKQQLAIPGRLVIPVGSSERRQFLLAVTRTAENRFRKEELGAVSFVPLIGEEGW